MPSEKPCLDSAPISNEDWNLLFRPVSNDAVRGAAFEENDFKEAGEQDFPPLKKMHPQMQRNPVSFTIREGDPEFLTRAVMFGPHIVFSTIFQFVLDFIQMNEQSRGSFQADQANALFRGGLFDETRFAEYEIKIFTFGGRLGLSLDVLKGFAPAVQQFWNELQQGLKEKDLLKCQEDESDEEEYDFLESDDEDGLPTLNLDDAKYLNLNESPELVNQWLQDLENPNFMQQTLLQMAWNCQNSQNFQVIAGDNQAQQLFDTIIACMIATAADFCLPIARCAALLISQLVDTHDIQVTNEQFNVLVQTLVQWSLENHAEEHKSKLTRSEEVASILSSQMSKMAPRAVNWKDTLQQVYTQAPYDSVRANLHQVVRAY